MTTKEKVINASITKIEKRLAFIEQEISRDYLGEFFKVLSDLLALGTELKGLSSEQVKAYSKQLKAYSKKLGEYEFLRKKTLNHSKNLTNYLTEKNRLGLELSDLKNELFFLNYHKNKTYADKT